MCLLGWQGQAGARPLLGYFTGEVAARDSEGGGGGGDQTSLGLQRAESGKLAYGGEANYDYHNRPRPSLERPTNSGTGNTA